MHRTPIAPLRWLLLGLLLLVPACAGGDALTEDTGGATEAEGGAAEETADGAGGPIVIGSANFPEQLVLANLYAVVLEDAGFEVDTSNLNLGSREVLFPALTSGELDLVPEYSGALLAFLTEGAATASAPEEVMEQLREELPEGVVALEPASAENKDVLVVLPETAEEYGLESIADLADVAGELTAGGPPEMETREQGLPALAEVYGVEFAEFRPLDAGGPLTTEALLSGQIDVGRMFSTQGVIDEEGLVVLDDPENLSPAQQIVPVMREEVLTEEIRTALNDVSATLTVEDLTAMNRQVEVDQEDPDAVAQQYLEDNGLIGS